MFTIAPLTIAKIWGKNRSPIADEQMMKTWSRPQRTTIEPEEKMKSYFLLPY